MSQTIEGKISFINHEKKYAMIEYEEGNKNKTVRASIDEQSQKQMKAKNIIKKTHHFMVGDVVSFQVKLSDRGDRMMASGTEFLYNNALDVLINKSFVSNKFIGYLKMVDDKYFVKEIDSYLFFPVPFSPWQIKPTEEELNEQVLFSLENLDKKDKIFASLLTNVYIPEFHTAVKSFKNKIPIEATIFNITAHGLYLHVINDKIQAKIPFNKNEIMKESTAALKPGDKIQVIISHVSKSRIAVEIV